MPSVSIDLDKFIDRGNEIVEAVTREGRIAASFLPKYSLSRATKNVGALKFIFGTTLFDDVSTVPLAQIRVKFTLDWQQLLEENFEASLFRVKKAADSYCTLEDRLLFVGQHTAPVARELPYTGLLSGAVPGIIGGEVERGSENGGLIDPNQMTIFSGRLPNVFDAISNAYDILSDATSGPWAVGLSSDVYTSANTRPPNAADSDRERIESLIGCKVLRVSILPQNTGFIMGGAATSNGSDSRVLTGPADRAVALEPELQYLDRTSIQG